jgi:hypothetical protein
VDFGGGEDGISSTRAVEPSIGTHLDEVSRLDGAGGDRSSSVVVQTVGYDDGLRVSDRLSGDLRPEHCG